MTVGVVFAVFVLFAGADWFAVGTGRKPLEYVCKPATMLPLILLALSGTFWHPEVRAWWVAALVFSLIGDVFLMLPNEDLFVAGLGSFLVGHLAFIGGFITSGLSRGPLLIGLAAVVVAGVLVGPIIVRGARERDTRLGIPVAVYIAVISVMVACACAAHSPVGLVGALLFYVSDFAIGWSQFVREFPHQRLVIIVTYHLGQLLLTISMLTLVH